MRDNEDRKERKKKKKKIFVCELMLTFNVIFIKFNKVLTTVIHTVNHLLPSCSKRR